MRNLSVPQIYFIPSCSSLRTNIILTAVIFCWICSLICKWHLDIKWLHCWKIWFCISYKTHSESNKHGCNEIQNQDLRIPLIFISIPHGAQEVWSLNQFTRMCSRENKRVAYSHIHTIFIFYILQILYVSLLIHNWLSNWTNFLGLPNWALVCSLRWDQREQIRL